MTARKVSVMMGLPVIGSVGLLMRAKKAGLIQEVKPLLDQMIQRGIRYHEKFYWEVLKSVGEL